MSIEPNNAPDWSALYFDQKYLKYAIQASHYSSGKKYNDSGEIIYVSCDERWKLHRQGNDSKTERLAWVW